MSEEFHFLEESLKSFLIDSQSDSYNAKGTNFYKYNNLRILMDKKKYSEPHFIVRIGISESVYTIETCERISGGLASDERYVHRWYEKTAIKPVLFEAWRKEQKAKLVQMNQPDDDY